jgi:predicted  nucleic acid-binding Zn-ribbon protein
MAEERGLAALPRMLSTAIEDVRTIARGMQVLPQLAKNLEAIERSAAHMDDEVTKMRAAVEAMSTDVKALEPSLEAKLEEVKDSMPLRRRRKKMLQD